MSFWLPRSRMPQRVALEALTPRSSWLFAPGSRHQPIEPPLVSAPMMRRLLVVFLTVTAGLAGFAAVTLAKVHCVMVRLAGPGMLTFSVVFVYTQITSPAAALAMASCHVACFGFPAQKLFGSARITHRSHSREPPAFAAGSSGH